jgi:hypothetical protein
VNRRAAALVVLAINTAACPRVDFSTLVFPSDGGTPDSGEQSMRCTASKNERGELESWWCLGATTAELDAFAAADDLSIIDIHIEPIENEQRVSAVLVPHDGLDHSWDWELVRELDEENVAYFPEITGRRIVDLASFPRDDGDSALAAAFTTDAYGCAWNYGRPLASEEAIRLFLSENRIRRQIVVVEPFTLFGYDRRFVVAFGSGSSTVALDAGALELENLLRENNNSAVRAFHSTPIAGRYDLSIGTSGGDEPPSFWVRDLDEEALIAYTEQSTDRHIVKLDNAVIDGERQLAALFVTNSAPTSRRADSLRYAERMAAAVPTATVGIYMKELGGRALLAFNERHQIFARNMLAPVIAAYALDAADRANTSSKLDDVMIDVPARGCGTSTVIAFRETLGNAVAKMLSERDAARATALVDRFGLEALRDRVTEESMPRTVLAVPPGCDEVALSSKTTLIDQAMFYEHALHCSLDGTHSGQLRAWMPGETLVIGDYEGFGSDLLEAIDKEALTAGLDQAQRDVFKYEAQVIYTSSDLSDRSPDFVRRALSGRLRIPYCMGTELDYDVYFLGFFIEGPGNPDHAEAILDMIRENLLVEPVRRGFRGGRACFVPRP